MSLSIYELRRLARLRSWHTGIPHHVVRLPEGQLTIRRRGLLSGCIVMSSLALALIPPPPAVPVPVRPHGAVEPPVVTTCHLQGETCWSDR